MPRQANSEYREHRGVRYKVGPFSWDATDVLSIRTATGALQFRDPQAIEDPEAWIDDNLSMIQERLDQAQRHHDGMMRECAEKGPGTAFNRSRGHLS